MPGSPNTQHGFSTTSPEAVREAREAFVAEHPHAAIDIEVIFALLGITDVSKLHVLRPKGPLDPTRLAVVRPLPYHDNGGQDYHSMLQATVIFPAPKTLGWKVGQGMLVDYNTGQVWPRGYLVSPNDQENINTGHDLRWDGGRLVMMNSVIYDTNFPGHAEHIVPDRGPEYFAKTMEPFFGGSSATLLPGNVLYRPYVPPWET